MRRKHFVGLDVHCQFTEMAIVSETGKLMRRLQCPTTIPALVRALQCVPRPLHIVLEEGPLADWLCRNLAGHAEFRGGGVLLKCSCVGRRGEQIAASIARQNKK
jgi:hypothetical protein